MSNAGRHDGRYYSFIQMYLCSIFALTSCVGEWCLISIKPREGVESPEWKELLYYKGKHSVGLHWEYTVVTFRPVSIF